MKKEQYSDNYLEELGVDPETPEAADLTRSEEELEQLVQESLAEDFGDAFPEEQPQEEAYDYQEEELEDIPQEVYRKAPLLRKLRPKMKGTYGFLGIPHILATAIWLALILFIGGSIGQIGWACATDLLALGKDPQTVSITLEAKEPIDQVALKLQEAGLIRYPKLFVMFAKFKGSDNLLFGTINFNNSAEDEEKVVYDYNALMNKLSYRKRSRKTVDIMIPEGYNCAQIFALLEEEGVCPAADLEAYAMNGELKEFWFMEGVKRDHKYCLEGFLFPDTYEFYLNDTPESILNKFLSNFNYRFSDDMKASLAALNARLGKNYTVYDVLTLASIVEREAANGDEAYIIASVFYNRLTDPNFYPKYLGSDATILYATEYRDKDTLTSNDAINASPYNTYTTAGLPPTPIANPGLSSLKAAVDPDKTDYLYFMLDKEAGVHRFSKTLAQHEALRKQLG